MNRTLRRIVLILACSVLTLMGSGAIAGAEETRTVISPGLSTTGGSVTDPDGNGARSLSSTESASMMQPLLAAMYFGSPQFTEPPASATRYAITFDYVFTAEDPAVEGQMKVNYAQQGSTGWISFPTQVLWPGTMITSEMADRWFVISPAFVAAFNGQATVQTFPTADTGTTTTSSSSSNPVLILVVILAAVIVLGTAIAITRRRGTSA